MDTPSKTPKSWAITVRCRSNGLDLRLGAANVFPNWSAGGERLTLFLRLRRFFLLTVESENRDLNQRRKNRFLGFLVRIIGVRSWEMHRRRKKKNKKKGNVDNGSVKAWNQFNSPFVVMVGSLSLLSHSSVYKDHKGIMIHVLSYMLNLILLFMSPKGTRDYLVFIPIFVSIVGFCFSYLSYTGLVWKAAWLALNWIVSLGFTSVSLSQVVFSTKALTGERRWIVRLFIFASIPILLIKFIRETLFQYIKLAIYGTPTWIPSLLINIHTLLHTSFEAGGKNYALGFLVSLVYFWGKEIISYLAPFMRARVPKLML